MLSQNLGDHTVVSNLSVSGSASAFNSSNLIAVASVKGTNTLIWKAANYGDTAMDITIRATGGLAFMVAGRATVITLTSTEGKDAANSFDAPDHVSPVTTSIAVAATGMELSDSVAMPPWSVVVVRIPMDMDMDMDMAGTNE